MHELFWESTEAYPEIHNYENAVVENKYFLPCGHMNDVKGAPIHE
jgi:hypothetical protein